MNLRTLNTLSFSLDATKRLTFAGLLSFIVVALPLSAQLKVDAGPDIFVCEGYSSKIGASFKGGSAPIHFQWSPAIGLSDATSQTPVVSPVQTVTTYIVTATDASNAVSSDTVIVTMNPRIVADAGVDIQGCVGASVTLGGSTVATGGTGPYKYQWMYVPANISSTIDEHPTFIPTRSGYGRYIVRVTDAVGCEAWDTILVQINQPMSLNIGTSGSEACAFSPHDLGGLGIASGGTAPYRYKWLPERGLSSPTISNPTAFPDTTTMYTLMVIDAMGCVKSDSVLVKVKPRIRTQLTKTFTVCPQTQVNLADSNFVSGGQAPYKFKWSTESNQLISNDSIANPYTIPANNFSGLALFMVDITDAIGCHIRDTVYVTVTQAPRAIFRTIETVCQNDTILYATSGNSNYQYNWAIVGGEIVSGGHTQTVTIRWTSPGIGKLDLTVYDPVSNCTSTAPSKCYVNPLPTPKVDVNGVLVICTGSGTTTRLQANSGYASYRWSSGQTTPSIVVSRGGVYSVTVRDSNGCKNTSAPVTITEVAPPVPVISGPKKICGGVLAQLHATPGFKQYTWSTGETDSVITISGPGIYYVSVSDSIGCIGTSDPDTVENRPVMVTTGGDPNFDAVETGLTYPTKEVYFKNTTTEDILIDSLVMLTTNIDIVVKNIRVNSTNYTFATMHGLRVKPNDEVRIELEYNPTIKDVNNYELRMSVVAPCEGIVSIKGNLASYDKTIWATASIPERTKVKPGANFNLPLSIQFDSPQDSVEDATLYLNLRLNAYMMDVLDDAGGTILSIDTLSNSWRILHMRFEHLTIKYSNPYLLTSLRCLALAGTKFIDTVFVEDRTIRWEPGRVPLKKPRVRTRNGILELEPYCFPHNLAVGPGKMTEMVVQPNPVSDDLMVYIASLGNQRMSIELYDTDGRVLRNMDFDANAGDNVLRLNVSDISAGVYPLVLRSLQGVRTQQVLILK